MYLCLTTPTRKELCRGVDVAVTSLLGSTTVVVEVPDHVSRLIVLGDPHGALETVRSIFQREMTPQSMAVCVGDVVGYENGPASSALATFLRDSGVPTVEGNHEAWVRHDGKLSIVEDRDADRQLSEEAVSWLRSLPSQIEFRRPTREDALAVMVHSIRYPRWDWLSSSNACDFLRSLGDPRLVLSGHSHRPKFIGSGPGYGTFMDAFDFEKDNALEAVLPDQGSLIVDAGSVGRAEVEPHLRSEKPRRRASRFGTYAVIDFDGQSATLRRQEV